MIQLTDVNLIAQAGWLPQLAATLNATVAAIRCDHYKFDVDVDVNGQVSLFATYIENDVLDGSPERQTTRRWPLTPKMTESEIVQTAFKCAITSYEHRAREAFRYRGERVFSPHFNVNDLVELCRRGRSDAGASPRLTSNGVEPDGLALAAHDPKVPA